MTNDSFLNSIFQYCEGMIEVRALPSGKQAFFQIDDIAGIEKFCAEHKRDHLYFGVGTRDGKGGGKQNIVDIATVWCDVDFKDTPSDALADRLSKFPYPPSIEVNSGGGKHIYWRLKKPASPDQFGRVEDVNKRIAAYLGGDLNSCDAARILRLPGTVNHKYPAMCEVKEIQDFRYELDDFLSVLPEAQKEKAKHANNEVSPDWLDEAMKGVEKGARNSTGARIVGYWINKVSPEDVLRILQAWNLGNTPPLPKRDIEKIVKSVSRYEPEDKSKGQEDAFFDSLASLSPREYEKVRKQKAKEKGFRVSYLDAEVQKRRPKGEEEHTDDRQVLCASFAGLVDLVTKNADIAYLCKEGNELVVRNSVAQETGEKYVPPHRDAIPFEILPADEIIKHFDEEDTKLYWAIFCKLKTVSVLPNDDYYHLCTIYIFFTYVAEASAYYPYLWFYGLPERGKSRIAKAIINLSHRGFYTETLNEALIFRFADLLKGTLGLDLYEISERAKKKGSHDLLLGRYERGMKVARVTAPDKGPFLDTQYFNVSGPTVLASNVEIPPKDPLRSRCIKTTMPEARGTYPNNNGPDQLSDLKARMLAFRARHLGESLPEMEKPVAGRLGDIIHPLLCTSKLLPNESTRALYRLMGGFEEERAQTESESLAGKIAEALYTLKDKVNNGRILFEELKDELNKNIDEKYHYAPQTIGRELSAMGVDRQKSNGVKHIIFDEEVMEKIFMRFHPSGEFVPNVPYVPDRKMTGAFERDDRDVKENSSLRSESTISADRDDRDERDESSKSSQTHLFDENTDFFDKEVIF